MNISKHGIFGSCKCRDSYIEIYKYIFPRDPNIFTLGILDRPDPLPRLPTNATSALSQPYALPSLFHLTFEKSPSSLASTNTLALSTHSSSIMAPSLTDAAPSHTIATPAPIGGDFSIFTSLRYDPQLLNSHANTEASSLSSPTPFYLLSHHRDRMLAAATHFSYPPAAAAILHSLEAFAQRLQEAVDTSAFGGAGPLKVCRKCHANACAAAMGY